MVIRLSDKNFRRGALQVDMLVAMTLLFAAAIPLAYSYSSDQRALRVSYERAVAMECLDGQMEILAAGGWRNQPTGTNQIELPGAAAKNLRPATALLIRDAQSIRLEWRPAGRVTQGLVREVKLP